MEQLPFQYVRHQSKEDFFTLHYLLLTVFVFALDFGNQNASSWRSVSPSTSDTSIDTYPMVVGWTDYSGWYEEKPDSEMSNWNFFTAMGWTEHSRSVGCNASVGMGLCNLSITFDSCVNIPKPKPVLCPWRGHWRSVICSIMMCPIS